MTSRVPSLTCRSLPRPAAPARIAASLRLRRRGSRDAVGPSSSISSSSLSLASRSFSVIQRGHDRHVESLYERLGFGADDETRRLQRTPEELRQGFLREARKLRDPEGDPADRARFAQLQQALRILADPRGRAAYDEHHQSSNDARLHVLQDGGAVSANFNPDFRHISFVNHATSLSEGAEGAAGEGPSSVAESDASSSSSAADTRGEHVSSSFGDFNEALHNATGKVSAAEAKARRPGDPTAPVHGADIHFMLKLSFEEGIFGCQKVVSLRRNAECGRCRGRGHQALKQARRCPQCLGRGTVHLPSGTYNMERECNFCGGSGATPPPPCRACGGSGLRPAVTAQVPLAVPARATHMGTFRVPRQGHAGARGGRTGDLIVQTVVTEHRFFYQADDADGDGGGYHLHAMVPVPLSTALLGGMVTVPTLAGRAALRVPPCVRNGEVLTVTTAPLPASAGAAADASAAGAPPPPTLHFHVLVIIPKGHELSGHQKASLQAYEDATAAAAGGSHSFTEESASSAAETDPAAPAGDDLYEQCAQLKDRYKHWFTA